MDYYFIWTPATATSLYNYYWLDLICTFIFVLSFWNSCLLKSSRIFADVSAQFFRDGEWLSGVKIWRLRSTFTLRFFVFVFFVFVFKSYRFVCSIMQAVLGSIKCYYKDFILDVSSGYISLHLSRILIAK